MLSSEIKRKIKFIQLRTNKILSGSSIGDSSTTFKGTGIEFDQISEYQEGDDIRYIDWKSSARSGKLLVKQYFEERNRNIILAIDISESTQFFSSNLKKYDIMAQIACILALVGQNSKDNVGLLLFSNEVHEFIHPNQGVVHISKIIKKIFEQKIYNAKTNLNIALEYLIKNTKKDSIVFLISDFIDDQNFEKNLKLMSKKSRLILIRCNDTNENILPNAGIITVKDFETGEELLVDLQQRNIQKINEEIFNFWSKQNQTFKKNNIKLLQINNQKDFFNELIYFFKYLMMY